MELAQLVGVVRHLSAQSAALQYLDQALTVVSTLDEQVAERKKALAEIEQSIVQKEVLAKDIISAAEHRRVTIDQELVSKQARVAKEIEQAYLEKDGKLLGILKDIGEAQNQLDLKRRDLENLLAIRETAQQELEGIKEEHSRVLSAIQELKSKLG